MDERAVIRNDIHEKYFFRNVRQDEYEQVIAIEHICFPPNEACSEKNMKNRITTAPEFFLVAIDKESGKIAGFLDGIATDECTLRDEFFTDISFHRPNGSNVMILGLDVLPEYRGQGLARELVFQYLHREKNNNRKKIILTCLESKVNMYKKFGFKDHGISASCWGSEEWHEMSFTL